MYYARDQRLEARSSGHGASEACRSPQEEEHPTRYPKHHAGRARGSGADHWPFSSNNPQLLLSLAVAGQGLIFWPSFAVGADILAGRLVPLLTEWRSRELTIRALYPHRPLPEKVRTFVSLAPGRCAALDPLARSCRHHRGHGSQRRAACRVTPRHSHAGGRANRKSSQRTRLHNRERDGSVVKHMHRLGYSRRNDRRGRISQSCGRRNEASGAESIHLPSRAAPF